ncbi:MAG: alpha/beta hydrolase [Glutamicibacter sp.]|uniref:alpha/beta fold hydrolase n=1 Tax=Glutamicibacter sp. TaxID=1931995 RepID=UPI002FC7E87B
MTAAKDQNKTPASGAGRDATDYPEVHPGRHHDGQRSMKTLVFLHGGNVGNWSWDPQVLAFGDCNILTLHLPAFGARFEETWDGLESAADDVAALIADEVSEGGVHLVGISLGGVIALHVAARHPELVDSVLITGTPVTGVGQAARAFQRMQLKLIGSEWFWRFQAGAYGMVDDERELFTEHGVKLKAENMRAIMDEMDPGGLPQKLGSYRGPVLALAGAKEPKVVQKSFDALRARLPQVITRVVPGMHHQWNIENPILFNSVLRKWISDAGLHQILVDPQAAKPAPGAKATPVEQAAEAPANQDLEAGEPTPPVQEAGQKKPGRFAGKIDPRKLDPKKFDLKKKAPKQGGKPDSPADTGK